MTSRKVLVDMARGSWCPSGDKGNSSKSIIKGYMEENVKKSLKLFKTFTKVEFYGENDVIDRHIENLMTITSQVLK